MSQRQINLKTNEIIAKYGQPSELGEYLVTIDLPYPMRIAWDLKISVKKMRCHKLIANNLIAVFNELLSTYGYEKLKKLEIDIFGGCFMFRKKRLGSSYSMHAWGIAIDLNPTKNGLRTPYLQAQFSKPEYKKMHEIFEKHGFINLGKTRNMDTMHFEISN
jgi:hypothetical protein